MFSKSNLCRAIVSKKFPLSTLIFSITEIYTASGGEKMKAIQRWICFFHVKQSMTKTNINRRSTFPKVDRQKIKHHRLEKKSKQTYTNEKYKSKKHFPKYFSLSPFYSAIFRSCLERSFQIILAILI